MFGGYPPTAIGYTPTAIGYPPTAIGYPPTAISYPPAAIIGRIGHSEFFFFFIMATPASAFPCCSLSSVACRPCATCSVLLCLAPPARPLHIRHGMPQEFPDECFSMKHDSEGVLGMANSRKNTNASQFYITVGRNSWMDGKYVAFGRVIEGISTLHRIHLQETKHNQMPTVPVVIEDCGEIDLTKF